MTSFGRRLLSAFGSPPAPPLEGREIAYRGGVVTFAIPRGWHEEYEPEGGGTFHDGRPDSGTLRLNLLTMERTSDVRPERLEGLIRSACKSMDCAIEPLAGGNLLGRVTRVGHEGGRRLTMHWWYVANAVDARHARLATFSYAVLAEQAKAGATVRDVAFIDASVCAIQFAPQLGE